MLFKKDFCNRKNNVVVINDVDYFLLLVISSQNNVYDSNAYRLHLSVSITAYSSSLEKWVRNNGIFLFLVESAEPNREVNSLVVYAFFSLELKKTIVSILIFFVRYQKAIVVKILYLNDASRFSNFLWYHHTVHSEFCASVQLQTQICFTDYLGTFNKTRSTRSSQVSSKDPTLASTLSIKTRKTTLLDINIITPPLFENVKCRSAKTCRVL